MKQKKSYLAHRESAQKVVVMTPEDAQLQLKGVLRDIVRAGLAHCGWAGVNYQGVDTLYVTPSNAGIK